MDKNFSFLKCLTFVSSEDPDKAGTARRHLSSIIESENTNVYSLEVGQEQEKEKEKKHEKEQGLKQNLEHDKEQEQKLEQKQDQE